MKIGLIDIDGHNFPNLALMKISAYHKSAGDIIEWVNYFNNYDRVYQSKVFTFSPDNFYVINADALERAMFLKRYNISVFAQPFRDFTRNSKPTREQKNFARWVNHKAIFNSCEFENYNH